MYRLLAATLIAALGSTQVAAAASTKPAICTTEHEPARLNQIEPMDYPAFAKLGAADTALIRVDLSATGRVLGTSVVTSSGSTILDRAAMTAVAASTYAPATEACRGVAASYWVNAIFDK